MEGLEQAQPVVVKSPPVAVKMYLEEGAQKIPATEFMAFWKACSDLEKKAFSETAARNLGVELAVA